MAIPVESLPPPGWGPRGIDALLDALPSGRLSEIVGPRSSGASSLLTALLAKVTATGHRAALVDGGGAFDPTQAAAAGADLHSLLWVRCGGRLTAALRAADLLARCPGFALIALDLGNLAPGERGVTAPGVWVRLERAIRGSGGRLLIRVPRRLAGAVAALVLETQRVEARWIGVPRPTRLDGLCSEIRVLRSRRGPLAPDGHGKGSGTERWTVLWRL